MESANQDHKKVFFEMLLANFEIGESSQQTVDCVVSEEIIGKNLEKMGFCLFFF